MSDASKPTPHSPSSVTSILERKAVAISEGDQLIVYEVIDEPPSGTCGCGDRSESTTDKKTITFVGTYEPVDSKDSTDEEKVECEYDIRLVLTISLHFQKVKKKRHADGLLSYKINEVPGLAPEEIYNFFAESDYPLKDDSDRYNVIITFRGIKEVRGVRRTVEVGNSVIYQSRCTIDR